MISTIYQISRIFNECPGNEVVIKVQNKGTKKHSMKVKES